MTDFIHTETNGSLGIATFFAWWNNTVPSIVPVGDRYIFQIGTQDLDEHPNMSGKQIDGGIVIRPVPGEGHTGVRFTGRKIQRSSTDPSQIFTHNCTGTGTITVEDMEIFTPIEATASSGRIISPASNNAVTVVFQRCLMTNGNSQLTRPIFPSDGSGDFTMVSCRFYQVVANASTRYITSFYDGEVPRTFAIQGNVFQGSAGDIQRGISAALGVNALEGSVLDVQGNIVLDTDEDYRVTTAGAGTLIFTENISGDLTGQKTGATLAADLISFDNPDVKAGSIALLSWPGKPTAFGAQLDIRGADRTGVAGTANWDAGSMQFSSSDVASDINLSPAGAGLQTMQVNDIVDLRHPLTLITQDSGTLQTIRTGTAVPAISGTDFDFTLAVISDPEADQLFPVLAGDALELLITGVGGVSLAPTGAGMFPLRVGDDLSLSSVDSDEEFDVGIGDEFSTVIGAGAPLFLVEDNDIVLRPTGETLDLESGNPDISVSIPLTLVDNPSLGVLYFTEIDARRRL